MRFQVIGGYYDVTGCYQVGIGRYTVLSCIAIIYGRDNCIAGYCKYREKIKSCGDRGVDLPSCLRRFTDSKIIIIITETAV